MTFYGGNPAILQPRNHVITWKIASPGVSFISDVTRSDHFVEPLTLMAAFLLLTKHKFWKVQQDDGRISHR